MEKPPIHELIEYAAAQKKLVKEAKRLRRTLREARKGADAVIETIVRLRRNPLARAFVSSAVLDQVRKLKKDLVKAEGGKASGPNDESNSLEIKYPGITVPK